VRAAIRVQIASALAQLKRRTPSDQEVHAARKSIKKARAAVRLVRDILGKSLYQRENNALRDAAHPLSATRDAKILLDVLQGMVQRGAVERHSGQVLQRSLDRHRKQLARRATARSDIASSRRLLRAADRRVAEWKLAGADAALILRAIRRAYRRAQRAMWDADAECSVQALHEWRKEVKYLGHQLQLLEPLQPGIGKLTDNLHKLADHLGENHDLAVLRESVVARRDRFSRRAFAGFLNPIDKRRLSLEKKAFTLGRRLFAQAPPVFARRFAALEADAGSA
jgi:hypothetical protein